MQPAEPCTRHDHGGQRTPLGRSWARHRVARKRKTATHHVASLKSTGTTRAAPGAGSSRDRPDQVASRLGMETRLVAKRAPPRLFGTCQAALRPRFWRAPARTKRACDLTECGHRDGSFAGRSTADVRCRNGSVDRLEGGSALFFLAYPRQFIFTAGTRTGTPGNQIAAERLGNPGLPAPRQPAHQRPHYQRQLPPVGGMCKMRLHRDHSRLPLCNR